MRYLALLIPLAAAAAGCSDDNESPTGPSGSRVSFFVTSQTSVTGNLGGLAGADATCRQLATAAGHGTNRIWRAYLSVERGPEGQPVHARDRIGPGPWHNAQLQLLANNPAELHAPRGRRRAVPGRARPTHQRAMDRIAGAGRARHPHRIECRRHPGGGAHLRRLDLGLRRGRGTGRPLRRLRAGPEPGRHPGLMERRAHQPELRQHGAARRSRAASTASRSRLIPVRCREPDPPPGDPSRRRVSANRSVIQRAANATRSRASRSSLTAWPTTPREAAPVARKSPRIVAK